MPDRRSSGRSARTAPAGRVPTPTTRRLIARRLVDSAYARPRMPTSPISGCSRVRHVHIDPHRACIRRRTSVSPLSCTQPMTSGALGRRLVADHHRLRRQRAAPRRAATRRCSAVRAPARRPRPARPASCAAGCRPPDRPRRPSCRGRRRAPPTARPTSTASSDGTYPAARRVDLVRRARAAAAAPVSSTTAGSPPCRAIICSKFLAARRPTPAPRAPCCSASCIARRPCSPSRTMRDAERARSTPSRSAGPSAAQHLDALGDLERVADGAAERRVHRA